VTDLTTRRVSERLEPEHPTALPEQRGQQGADAPPSPPDGVQLSRLLAMVRLTAAQAVELGAGVLAAASSDSSSDSAPGSGGPDGDVLVEEPVVTVDGLVVPGPAANGRGGGPSRRSARDVLAGVVAAVPSPGPAAEQRAAELDRALRDLPVVGVPAVARRLQEAAAGIDRPAVRAELAALVRAVGATGAATGGVMRTGGAPPARRAEPVRRASSPPRSTGRRVGAWVLSILVLAGVVVSEVVLLRDDITADIDLLLDAGREGEEPSDTPEPDDQQLPAPAPAAAGSVAAVDLRPLAPCAPGAACTVRLALQLVPSAEPQVVTWSYLVADRCTGPTVTAPGGTVTVPPQADRAAAVGVVALPPVDGVAVTAVTAVPAVAASAPFVVGSCGSAGQGG
jgi:hypothetical protein